MYMYIFLKETETLYRSRFRLSMFFFLHANPTVHVDAILCEPDKGRNET